MNVKNICDEALKRSDPTKRGAFLAQDCGDDTELRQQVAALVRAHEQADGSLDRPAAAEATSDAPGGQWVDPDNLPDTPLECVC